MLIDYRKRWSDVKSRLNLSADEAPAWKADENRGRCDSRLGVELLPLFKSIYY